MSINKDVLRVLSTLCKARTIYLTVHVLPLETKFI